MTQPYIAQVAIFSFNFAPRNWAYCNGNLIAIAQNQALYSLIGTTYGGNGIQNFALPNIQDGSVMSIGQGPGLSNYVLGQHSGVAEVTVTQNEMPAHNHTVSGEAATAVAGYELKPQTNYWIGSREGGPKTDLLFAPQPTPGNAFSPQVIAIAGGSLPHQNEQPYLGMNYCIALYGIYPARN